MGLSASQGRMLLLTARRSDLEFRAQQISQKRLILSQQLEEISQEYEDATSNRIMNIDLYHTEPDGSKVRSTKNLTYAALMSATYGLSSNHTGVQVPAGQQYNSDGYESVKPYRLVDADGAIVVSSLSEIQSTVAFNEVKYEDSSEYKNANGTSILPGLLYEQKTLSRDDENDSENVDSKKLVFNAAALGADHPLATIAKNPDNYDNLTVKIDSENKIACVSYKDADGNDKTEYYSLVKTDGAYRQTKLDPENDADKELIDDYDSSNAKSVELSNGVPRDTINETIYSNLNIGNGITETANLKGGRDGKYTLYDNAGNVIARYVVDPGLAYGSTDIAGTTTGPNYLQDCLRNGKYLLEQGNGLDDQGNYKWSSVSWDSTANISDSYYTEDDDAAKAKYDRLQTQIQNQDKKLELELDNIETQRQAVTTEIESIQKVIDENIEGTFNTFNA